MGKEWLSKRILVEGMTCSNCELKIEHSLSKISGVGQVKVKYDVSLVEVMYDSDKISLGELVKVIESLDYKVMSVDQQSDQKEEHMKKNKNSLDIDQLLSIGIIIAAVYMIGKHTGIFTYIPEIKPSMGYGILFVVGLLTSFHCIAMCGGITLSQSLCYTERDTETQMGGKITPSLLYNAGRVISYTLIGGMVGALGSVISFSGTMKGIVAIIAGALMVVMGLNMINIFPAWRKYMPRMPKIIGQKLYKNHGKYSPFYVGLLNGFMPCGPLQSMQIYALGTGSFVSGALSMFFFSLGTVPLLFAFGAISTILSKQFTQKMMKISAILVIILGVVMFNRGVSLSGVSFAFAQINTAGNTAVVQGDVQVVSIDLESNRYKPIVVKKGIPVKFIIRVKEGTLNGCNNPITIPRYGIQQKLVVGENSIEFFPEEEGIIPYSCWMGMIRSSIQVVSEVEEITDQELQQLEDQNTTDLSGGCCGVDLGEK